MKLVMKLNIKKRKKGIKRLKQKKKKEEEEGWIHEKYIYQ
jgi:hypothetical protein